MRRSRFPGAKPNPKPNVDKSLVQIAKALNDTDYPSKVGFCLLIVLSRGRKTGFSAKYARHVMRACAQLCA
jgi:hypothetical protein